MTLDNQCKTVRIYEIAGQHFRKHKKKVTNKWLETINEIRFWRGEINSNFKWIKRRKRRRRRRRGGEGGGRWRRIRIRKWTEGECHVTLQVKLCGACCLVCAVVCVVITVTTTVVHMNRLQTLRECIYNARGRTCTCFTGSSSSSASHFIGQPLGSIDNTQHHGRFINAGSRLHTHHLPSRKSKICNQIKSKSIWRSLRNVSNWQKISRCMITFFLTPSPHFHPLNMGIHFGRGVGGGREIRAVFWLVYQSNRIDFCRKDCAVAFPLPCFDFQGPPLHYTKLY